MYARLLIADGLRNSIAARTALGTSKSITLLAWAETENDRIALHQQNKHGNASRSHRQKPLPDPRNKMNGVHVNAPLTDLIEQVTECAASLSTTNGVSEQWLRET